MYSLTKANANTAIGMLKLSIVDIFFVLLSSWGRYIMEMRPEMVRAYPYLIIYDRMQALFAVRPYMRASFYHVSSFQAISSYPQS